MVVDVVVVVSETNTNYGVLSWKKWALFGTANWNSSLPSPLGKNCMVKVVVPVGAVIGDVGWAAMANLDP